MKFDCGCRPGFRLFSCLAVVLVIGVPRASLAQQFYQNPVIAGDYPDPSIIRVGNGFWATATSSEWGPQFPLLHSTDLVNWRLAGPVFPHRPAWAIGNFWAPEISEYKGKYFVYYAGRKRGGPLSVAVATAEQPQGPYTDHGPIVSQPDGSIDPVPVVDEQKRRFLIWKEDGNSRKLPTILWAQELSDDGLRLEGEPKQILRNDAAWEGAVVEGPFVVHRGTWFYLFYSGNGCCGRGCSYALGVARARTLLGPWEKNPANPILAGNEHWKCPGHGSIVEDGRGRYWLLYHAYSARDFVFTGREAMLDEVKFGANDWPEINRGAGPSAVAASPFGARQKLQGGQSDYLVEDFHETLKQGWQWPQENEPMSQVGALGLTLRTGDTSKTNILGAILARSTIAGTYEALVLVRAPAPAVYAGLAAIGDEANAAGLAIHNGRLTLWRADKGVQRILTEIEGPKSELVFLRLTATDGSKFRFAASGDRKTWIDVGEPQSGDQLPPWDRSIRVGLTVGGTTNAAGSFESFEMRELR